MSWISPAMSCAEDHVRNIPGNMSNAVQFASIFTSVFAASQVAHTASPSTATETPNVVKLAYSGA